MKKWTVSIPVLATAVLTIRAETKEEALEKANKQGIKSSDLSYDCPDDMVDPEVEEIID